MKNINLLNILIFHDHCLSGTCCLPTRITHRHRRPINNIGRHGTYGACMTCGSWSWRYGHTQCLFCIKYGKGYVRPMNSVKNIYCRQQSENSWQHNKNVNSNFFIYLLFNSYIDLLDVLSIKIVRWNINSSHYKTYFTRWLYFYMGKMYIREIIHKRNEIKTSI